RLVPYFSRAEIEAGAVAKDWPVLLWTDDRVDLFVTHVQGSALVRLAGGATTRIGYAADNGMTFVAIGRLMLERKIIAPAQASMQGIRAWLKANPAPARLLMQENPRYIFFREIVGAGPVGAQGVPLSPGRSLAGDPRYIPPGAPLWLDTSWPGRSAKPLRRLVVAQDRGNAIKGAVRGDVYWGSGEPALEQAGRMKQPGAYYLLLPRALADRLAAGKT
ncbi:MAG: MltA domain-containing protein, partial [Pseudomonadota bacterium]